jgi:hypothetical protein
MIVIPQIYFIRYFTNNLVRIYFILQHKNKLIDDSFRFQYNPFLFIRGPALTVFTHH